MMLVRLVLLPFTILYGTAIVVRDFLYSSKILSRTKFDFPIICVGNIAAGGTGKTPHIEWLIRLLGDEYKVAVLSRGYKRKTTGYVLADETATPQIIGDEPYQIFQNFPNVAVAVSENRVLGIPHLLGDTPDTQVVLMDDGLQHLPIQPGFSIILTDYNHPFYNDWLLPSGRLREFRSAYKRAQCIIVTKCPATLRVQEQQAIIKQINPLASQQVFFSTIQYGALLPVFKPTLPHHIDAVLCFSGIAQNQLFLSELQSRYPNVQAIDFTDHKEYTETVLADISQQYAALFSPNKIIITTQKDAVKLHTEAARTHLGNLPVFYLPISVRLFNDGETQMKDTLKEFIEGYRD